MRHRLKALLAGALLLDAGAALAAWQDDLAAEIRATNGCRVAYLSQVVERQVDGRQVVFAKAHCEDGRVFDATRTDVVEPFSFKECQPTVQPQAC
jgi:hypothetical protein